MPQNEPFSTELNQLSDDMGIGVFQTFSLQEASLLLRCPIGEVKRLCEKHEIVHIRISKNEFSFFGHHLLQHILKNTVGITEKVEPFFEPEQNEDRLIRNSEVQKLTGLSRSTIWRLQSSGNFPPSLPLTSRLVGWRLSDIQEWIRDREC